MTEASTIDPNEQRRYLLDTALAVHRVIEPLVEGALLVDEDARILWISDAYTVFLGIDDPAACLGRDVEYLLPQSRMRAVIEKGGAHPLDMMDYGDRFLLVTRLPIFDVTGRVVGAFAFAFKDVLPFLKPLMDRLALTQLRFDKPEDESVLQRAARYSFTNILGGSQAIRDVRLLARRAAQFDSPVLLQGETGTGKELAAHAIHSASPRFDKPFVTVNMASVPETLMESEFFGTAPGAYTGAGRERRPGKFQLAHKGTLFLDEIGDMPPVLQAKLNRVLQEGEVEPLGSNRLIKVDVRIIAATSRNLREMVKAGQFRADLYYRLSALPIHIPPLRERKEDIPLLAAFLLDRLCVGVDGAAPKLTEEAIAELARHDWPGNIRELGNVLQQACFRSESGVLKAADFSALLSSDDASFVVPDNRPDLGDAVEELERKALLQALQKQRGNKAAMARSLGISRSTLYAKLARYGLGI